MRFILPQAFRRFAFANFAKRIFPVIGLCCLALSLPACSKGPSVSSLIPSFGANSPSTPDPIAQNVRAGLNRDIQGRAKAKPRKKQISQAQSRSKTAPARTASLKTQQRYLIQPTPTPSKQKPKKSAAKQPATSFSPNQIRREINKLRASNGLPPIKIHPELTRTARLHARDMAKQDKITHTGSDGSTAWQRLERSAFKAKVAAENIGVGQQSAAQIMKSWRNSAQHKQNLLIHDATHIGIARAKNNSGSKRTYWTLIIGAPL